MQKSVLKRYARLIARVGGGVTRGQEVVITAGLDQPDFVTLLAEECYRLGAARVTVDWQHQPLSRLAVRYQRQSTLSKVAPWEEARWRERAEHLPVMLYLDSDDPDGLAGIDQGKMQKSVQARAAVIKPIRDRMENRYQWCIAAVPGEAWARKMFPGLRASQAVEKLWGAILHAARADGENPVADWTTHNRDLAARCDTLNRLGIRALRYRDPRGTELRVGLIERGRFCGGDEKTLSGAVFNPNMPTEEIFTSPRRGDAEGIVFASRPLSYRGELIEDFSVRFHEGRAVEVHAARGENLLRELVALDEGAAYLGEVALVPADSPICTSGLLYYNTLFDENAACHLALGRGFNECIEGYEGETPESLRALGVNDSLVHADFMIGTPELDIDAECADGQTVPLFRNGCWAF